jgi:hypothetical protein
LIGQVGWQCTTRGNVSFQQQHSAVHPSIHPVPSTA